jgi:tRNA threonylcarbamoyladenosine biosynthesis protein TsaB
MQILALDTSSTACSAAVCFGGVIRARQFEIIGRGHAERLVPMITEVLDAAETEFTALDLLATTVGPGTFTGLRVGLATARGLALAGDLPVAGITTFEAIAHDLWLAADLDDPPARGSGARLIAALDARRGEIYVQAFHADMEPAGPPKTGPAEEIAASWPAGKTWYLAGTGAGTLATELQQHGIKVKLGPPPGLPDAAAVADLCVRRYGGRGHPFPTKPPSPMYLRPPGARIPGNICRR